MARLAVAREMVHASTENRLLLLGSSVRAAAFSARRAGYTILAADMFADVDLRECSQARRVTHYPTDLRRAAVQHPGVPWMYTGGLENHPRLVDRISAACPLYGNPGRVLRGVRNPRRLARVLNQAGLRFPSCVSPQTDVPPDGRWLLKPLRSCGGGGVHVWDGSGESATTDACIVQKRIDGTPCSAVFVAAGGQAVFLSATEQLIGTPWCRARGFRYGGSIGPLSLAENHRRQFDRIGECLAGEFGLVGLFGVDAILTPEDVWPVEVNPRYTASIEVLERALGFHAVDLHVNACRDGQLPRHLPHRSETPWCGKAILFARRDVRISQHLTPKLAAASEAPWPQVADLPAPDTHIAECRPILTVFATADSRQALLRDLRTCTDTWERQLYGSSAE